MIYNQDDEDVNFLSDKKVGEVDTTNNAPKRRGGAYQEKQVSLQKVEEEDTSLFSKVVVIIAIVVIIIAVIVLVRVFSENMNTSKKNNGSTTNNDSNVTQNDDTLNNNSDNDSNISDDNNSVNSLAISSLNDMYDAYDIDIESVVDKKGGNFYNNNEKIKGDKVYVEYKQISGLKYTQKEEMINEKLKSLSVDLYDKNYLSDENTLFIDIHTKLSVNFNTLSYVVIKTYEDIDGNRKDEKAISYNIRLDNLEEIDFEELFVDDTNIKNIYKEYVKGKVNAFYFDPQNIYIYDEDLTETKIDMSKYYSDIAIYNRYKDSESIFKATPKSKKVFTTLESTVSEETTDRAFEQN